MLRDLSPKREKMTEELEITLHLSLMAHFYSFDECTCASVDFVTLIFLCTCASVLKPCPLHLRVTCHRRFDYGYIIGYFILKKTKRMMLFK